MGLKKKGLTLVELILSMIMASILLLALLMQYVMMARLKKDLEDRVWVMREASVITTHMRTVYRFINHASTQGGGFLFMDSGTSERIMGDVLSGHNINLVPANNFYYYRRIFADNSFEFGVLQGSGIQWSKIGDGVSSFGWPECNYNTFTHLLTLRFTVTRGNASMQVETALKTLNQ